MAIAIIVHGGSGDIPEDMHADYVAGCRAAVAAGWSMLQSGHTALEAVEAVVHSMEDDPTFDAGRGSVLNLDGEVELDAGIMDGKTLRAGAIAAVKRIANPITLALRVLHDSEHVFLVAGGAERFAERVGIPLCDPAGLVIERERLIWEACRIRGAVPGSDFRSGPGDTVGAVAVDADGNLAAGNSTGGTTYKWPGRVGDTPIIGCGLYADNQLGAAVCTGWGEQIMKSVLAKSAVDQVNWLNDASAVAQAAVSYFRHRIGGLGGVICAAPDGRIGFAYSARNMAYAYRTSGMADVLSDMGTPEKRKEHGTEAS